MLDLRRRREFQGKHLRGTAIDLPKSADLPAAAHLEITYLSTDVLTAIEAIGPAQERPVVLIGDRGYGKSHLMAWLHHALHEPAAARAWLCEWAAALDSPASVCFPSATSRLSWLLCPFPSVTVPLSSQVDPLPQSVASRLAGEAPEPLPTGRTTANQRGRPPRAVAPTASPTAPSRLQRPFFDKRRPTPAALCQHRLYRPHVTPSTPGRGPSQASRRGRPPCG